jgi:hypothetical protein
MIFDVSFRAKREIPRAAFKNELAWGFLPEFTLNVTTHPRRQYDDIAAKTQQRMAEINGFWLCLSSYQAFSQSIRSFPHSVVVFLGGW